MVFHKTSTDLDEADEYCQHLLAGPPDNAGFQHELSAPVVLFVENQLS
jgi:hypothetical protein